MQVGDSFVRRGDRSEDVRLVPAFGVEIVVDVRDDAGSDGVERLVASARIGVLEVSLGLVAAEADVPREGGIALVGVERVVAEPGCPNRIRRGSVSA